MIVERGSLGIVRWLVVGRLLKVGLWLKVVKVGRWEGWKVVALNHDN